MSFIKGIDEKRFMTILDIRKFKNEIQIFKVLNEIGQFGQKWANFFSISQPSVANNKIV